MTDNHKRPWGLCPTRSVAGRAGCSAWCHRWRHRFEGPKDGRPMHIKNDHRGFHHSNLEMCFRFLFIYVYCLQMFWFLIVITMFMIVCSNLVLFLLFWVYIPWLFDSQFFFPFVWNFHPKSTLFGYLADLVSGSRDFSHPHLFAWR